VNARAREELRCPRRDVDIVLEGVIHLGVPPNNLRCIIPIGCENQWDNYVRSGLKSQLLLCAYFLMLAPIFHALSVVLVMRLCEVWLMRLNQHQMGSIFLKHWDMMVGQFLLRRLL
jgi:hypothetical protein